MYLLTVPGGKETLIITILRKNGIEARKTRERGLLISKTELPPFLLSDLKGYILSLTEIDDNRAEQLTTRSHEQTEIRAGDLIEVVAGPYEGLKGIARKVSEGEVSVELNFGGKTISAQVAREELKITGSPLSWV